MYHLSHAWVFSNSCSNCMHSTCIVTLRLYQVEYIITAIIHHGSSICQFDSYSQTGKFDILIVSVINWITRTMRVRDGFGYSTSVWIWSQLSASWWDNWCCFSDYCTSLVLLFLIVLTIFNFLYSWQEALQSFFDQKLYNLSCTPDQKLYNTVSVPPQPQTDIDSTIVLSICTRK